MKKLVSLQKDFVIFKPESLKELEALALVLSSNHRFFADEDGSIWRIGDIKSVSAIVMVACDLEYVCDVPEGVVVK